MKKILKIVLVVVGLFVVLAIIGGAIQGGKTKKTASPATLTSAASTTTTTSALDAWLLEHGHIFTVLGQDDQNLSTQISADTSSGNYASVSQACVQLGTDAKADEALPPIPNAKYAQQISQLLTNVSQASTLCVSGIANSDTNEIIQVGKLLSTSNHEASILSAEFGKAAQG